MVRRVFLQKKFTSTTFADKTRAKCLLKPRSSASNDFGRGGKEDEATLTVYWELQRT